MKPAFWNDEEWERMRQKAAQHRTAAGEPTVGPQSHDQAGMKRVLRSGMLLGLLAMAAAAVVVRAQPDRAAFLIFGAVVFGLCASMYAVVDHRPRGSGHQ